MKTKLFILVGTVLSLTALANLTVTVTPGYTFGETETPTIDHLNQLGQPTVEVTGTLDGSTSLAAGSVNGTLLADTVVDGVTTIFNASVPRAIQVQAVGLIGQGGISASNNIFRLLLDPNYFQLATNSIASTNSTASTNWLTFVPLSLTDTNISATAGIQTFKLAIGTNALPVGTANGTVTNASLANYFQLTSETNANSANTNVVTLAPAWYATAEQSVTNTGALYQIPHNLPVTPRFVRWVMLCKTNDAGYAVGDEVDFTDIQNANNQASYGMWGANATNVFLTTRSSNINLYNKTNFSLVGITANNWRFKCYYGR